MFSGDPKEYLTFWSIFSKIHDSEELTAIDKFQYLYQSMEPDLKAARLISSFPITAENYPKAIEQLKLRFGREDLLVQIYVRDLLSLVLSIRDTWKLLSELASRGIKLTDVGRDSPPIRVLLGADILGNILTGRIEKKNESLFEEETLAHFKETIRICEDKRYEVALPWLAGHPALYDKYHAAESRLRTATKRLINENYFEAYNNIFKQWESEGIIEAVPIDQLAKEAHYLPHRPVNKPSSNTTKVRPVFDASFKKPGFASLNECLSVGPSLIHKILPLLLRFRFGAIELEQLKSQSIEIMKEGAFELRCWASNDSKEDQDMQMVLGLSWDVVSDELSCKLPSNLDCTQERLATKRVLLSVINSVYDPIGFTAPALLLPKLLMQEAWRGKISWNEVLPQELEHKYRLWEKTMHLMSKCTIPRRVFAENYDDFTLHIFTDASAYAYATCAFLRYDWQHVPGEVNPADLATRCCDWSDLLKSKWWEGPGWLYSDEESWPCFEVSETPDEAFLERCKTVVTNLATGNEVRFGDRFLYFLSYKKILRMTAYVLGFCNNIKRNSPKLVNSLSCEEIQKAEETLIKIMQSEWPSEIHQKYKDTIQFFKENGILKVQTRLILSQDPEDFTHPTVLPDHPLLERLVLHTHRSLMHAGVLTTLAQLREKFWIPKGRRVVRAIL
ncbi:integrase catalytic domain-containing protein [Trichonephila inaurata madagascariensis]|uniref:Integrase catalytic domain-containing protein n=1 Tax=Trichonephila inaurata madagascariensis TaxID=2747483 RepID=A0A8X6KGX8_9ARAC|nr:integrase catalytic domain-containing protein [Trichonephila inaurata madagascariensis]